MLNIVSISQGYEPNYGGKKFCPQIKRNPLIRGTKVSKLGGLGTKSQLLAKI